ncbi:MAG: fumarylacetoacetate hydrolase family protein [Burkholderiaceae bacterium]|nr:fumarylacetoacetate hydrolase family protein [Burkholderiaceae bacterium]
MQALPRVEPVSIAIAGSPQRFAVHRVYCVGRNYADHAKEMGASGREPPFFFFKPSDTLFSVADGATAEWPYPSLTQDLHHEVELVVAIGRGGRDIPVERAHEHIWGYAVGLDMTRRDLQSAMKKESKPWCIGKGFDFGAPIGPLVPIETSGELTSGAITLKVNDVVRQQGDLSDLIWSINEVIAHVSKAWELKPGDLIFTGTPAGVGAVGRGDVLVAEAAKLGGFSLKVV